MPATGSMVAAVLVAVYMPPQHLEEDLVQEPLEEVRAQPVMQTGG
mgnify:CR=1 FL=1